MVDSAEPEITFGTLDGSGMHSQFMTNTVVYWYRQMSFSDATYAFTVQHMLFECVGASMQLHSWPESTAASLTAYIHAVASLVMEVEDKNRLALILIFVCCLFFTDSDSNACDSAQRNDESSRESIAASMPFQTRVDAIGSLTCLHWIHTGRPLWRRVEGLVMEVEDENFIDKESSRTNARIQFVS